MTDDNFQKPVFFSTNLHDDLPQAFDELRKIHEALSGIVRVMDERSDSAATPEHKNDLQENADLLLGQADNLEKWITTYEDAVGAELADNHLVYERDTYQTLTRILIWDKADVRQLARLIRELKVLTGKIGLTMPYLLHVRQIPTEAVPDDVAKFPVFVVDRQGYCLCGMELEEIHSLDEVRDMMSA
ncbi:MAG: hypothetical protein Q4Q04_04200 [Methanocorpusculum sp.]|nr:hypothetical protein [Methanocorpusculum sp.]